MIKNILTVGDSFTYGEELANREDDCWANKLATGIKANVINLGKPGSGNRRMVRNVIEHAVASGSNQTTSVDLVIIGWSSPGRIEFADEAGMFDIWPGYGGALFRKDNQDWRLELLEYINKYHSPEYLYKQYLLDVIMLQGLLKERDIKYLMLTTVANEYYHNVFFSKLKPLVDLVDPTYFVGWPTEGMAEWTVGCKRGPNGHFLEDGHKKVTAKLYQHIKKLGWI